ncbi:hypothetical protein QFC21_006851 [Naganishia friedmannii]|uniref:Uncharacterized protein n=1 Tax=Naganishia friedmannii TaxID=89922 RepID=A0ACC2V0X2_9TREE|nr:hypothetical protein QFC21_006851 [Naganishia friedmannii]
MASTVLMPHVRLPIFRHYAALAGFQAPVPSISTASSASRICYTAKRFSSSVPRISLDASFPGWKEGCTKLTEGEERDSSSHIRGQQNVIAGQRFASATAGIKALPSWEFASSATSFPAGDGDASGMDTTDDLHDGTSHADHTRVTEDADMYAEALDASLDAGDPFDCDHIDMRLAKARSKYAWVTCETKFEKFVLQAQGRLYFCIERIHDVENVAYDVSYALGRGSDFDRDEPVLKGAKDFRSLFQSRNTVAQVSTREEAFRLAEILIQKIIVDKTLLTTMRRTARWRAKPCTLKQLNMLLLMQSERRKPRDAREGDARSDDLFGEAVFLNAGEPQETIAVRHYASTTANDPPPLVEIRRTPNHDRKRVDPANGFWQ